MTTADKKPTKSTNSNADTGDRKLSEAFVLLDNSSTGGGASLLFQNPLRVIVAHDVNDVPRALEEISDALDHNLHLAGFFAYELGFVLEPRLAHLMPAERKVPLIWFGVYDLPDTLTSRQVADWLDERTLSHTYEFTDVELAWQRDDYLRRFSRVQEMIASGDIYQLNLTFKARFSLSGSPLAFYRDMRQRQRVAYGGIVDTGAATVLSASPELFIEQNGRIIETRPMKGTAPRAGREDADAEQRRILATDVKQRAENLMIVDLMRNDLGRIAETGSVSVTDLFTVETFRTLHQMTSGVRATLQDGIGLREVLDAIFPPGSVTGAPKIRAMELIHEIETEARGVYCGAIGTMAPGGKWLFNVAIRTPVVFRDGTGEMGIGSGVVYDSVGTKEYDECLLKLKFLTDPPKSFELIETMLRDETGAYVLLERHLERLAASAHYFGFPYDHDAVVSKLNEIASNSGDGRLRVRLLLAEDGGVSVTATPLPPATGDAVMRFIVSETRLKPADPFLYHKTTRRELYDREWQQAHDAYGADEVIYLNEAGELAEGSRTTIFVSRGDKLLTPPLESGLLPGTLRAELLATGSAVEARLTLQDLQTAERVYLGNSVRGLMKAIALED